MTKAYENLLGMHKKRFQCLIDDVFCIGLISVVRSSVYLCQNVHDGNKPNDTLGFKYGWCVGNGCPNDLDRNQVTQLVIIDTDLSADINDYEEISKAMGISQVLTDDQADLFVTAFRLGMEYAKRMKNG